MCRRIYVIGNHIGAHTLPNFEVCLLTAAKGVSSGTSEAFMAGYLEAYDACHTVGSHSCLFQR